MTKDQHDFYPQTFAKEIDIINDKIYNAVNNGVYKCGFATTQMAYEQAFYELFSVLDELELRLTKQHYLIADQLTEADWRLFTTLVRFDAVYFGHFKANYKRISDYPALQLYLKRLYTAPSLNFRTRNCRSPAESLNKIFSPRICRQFLVRKFKLGAVIIPA